MKASDFLTSVCKIEILLDDLSEIKSKLHKMDSDYSLVSDYEDQLKSMARHFVDMAKDRIEFSEEYTLSPEKI